MTADYTGRHRGDHIPEPLRAFTHVTPTPRSFPGRHAGPAERAFAAISRSLTRIGLDDLGPI